MMLFELEILTGEDPLNSENGNVDVRVLFLDGKIYSGTFFSLQNIKTLMASYEKTGECSNGLYFWSSNMILLEKLTVENIEKSVKGLIESGEIYNAFVRIQ